MSGPEPSNALVGHCAAINDNTLYVLSPTGLQSLPLQTNATWSAEPQGSLQLVTGPACVTVGNGSDAALYVIGGSSNIDSYNGVQRYSFSGQSWETLSLPTDNMQQRTDHSAAYLQDSNSILVYAGSQPESPSDLSSQTFLINLDNPYNIESFTSNAPPTKMPILQPWNSSHAVMLGGTTTNTQIFLFSPEQGWTPLDTNLTTPIDASTRGTIIDGSDGSKVLELINPSVSPNQVSQIVLLDANGAPAQNGQTVGGATSSRRLRRDLSLGSWPSYNNTNAPLPTRTDCAVVQGPSGIVAMSGGSSQMPVALFDSTENSWVDLEQFFGSKQPLQPSSTVSMTGSANFAGTATSTATSSQSSTSDNGAAGATAHQQMLRTLGTTLGVLCGIAAVFILALLYLRWRKQQQRQKEGYVDEKTGNRMSFADRGASFMKEAGGSVGNLLPPGKGRYSTSANGSHSSLAIIAGKFGGKSHQQKDSFESTARLVKDRSISEPMEMLDIGDKKLAVPASARKPVARNEHSPGATLNYSPDIELAVEDRRGNRSSGWSKYFATSGPTGPNGLSHLPAAYAKPQDDGSPYTEGSEYSSKTLTHPSRIPSSILVPPLDIDFSKTIDGQRLSTVARGSPSLNHSTDDLARRGSVAEFVDGPTLLTAHKASFDRSSQISGYSLSTNKRTTVGSTLSSNITTDYHNMSGDTPWTPISFKDHLNSRPDSIDRPTSSNYANSVYEPPVPSRGRNGGGFFPGSGTSFRPTIPASAKAASRLGATSNNSTSSDLAKPPALNIDKAAAAEERESTITVFPRGVPSAYYAEGENAKEDQPKAAAATGAEPKAVLSDMSWVNLGLGSNKI